MKTDIIGRQPRRCTPGGFSEKKSRGLHLANNSVIVREAANRVLEKRSLLNQPHPWEAPPRKDAP